MGQSAIQNSILGATCGFGFPERRLRLPCPPDLEWRPSTMAISKRPILVAVRKNWLKITASAAILLATLLSAILVGVEILRLPGPALVALAMGVYVR
jgi:hypothetical protein